MALQRRRTQRQAVRLSKLSQSCPDLQQLVANSSAAVKAISEGGDEDAAGGKEEESPWWKVLEVYYIEPDSRNRKADVATPTAKGKGQGRACWLTNSCMRWDPDDLFHPLML